MKKIYVGIGHGEIMKISEGALIEVFGEENIYTLTQPFTKKKRFGNNFTDGNSLIESLKEKLAKEKVAKGEKVTIHIALNFPESVYNEKESFDKIRQFISELKKLPNCEFEFSTAQTNNPPKFFKEKFNIDKLFITCPSRVGAYFSCYGKQNLMLDVLKISHQLYEEKSDFSKFQASGWNLCCMPALIWDVLSKKTQSKNPKVILDFLKKNPDYSEALIENFKDIVPTSKDYERVIKSVVGQSIEFLKKNQDKSLEDIIATVATKGGATEKMLKSFDEKLKNLSKNNSQISLEKVAARHIAIWSGFAKETPAPNPNDPKANNFGKQIEKNL